MAQLRTHPGLRQEYEKCGLFVNMILNFSKNIHAGLERDIPSIKAQKGSKRFSTTPLRPCHFRAGSLKYARAFWTINDENQDDASKTRKRYAEEFKAQALELLRTGKPVSELAEELCVSTDLRALLRENAQLRMENDILKKAAIVRGTKSPHNSTK